MADREKIVRAVETCFDSWIDKHRNMGLDLYKVEQMKQDALELLKEQGPIKPTVSVDTWICSKCGHTLESQELIDDKENPQVLVHEQYKYCPCCGRKVMWDG